MSLYEKTYKIVEDKQLKSYIQVQNYIFFYSKKSKRLA